jgi:hypothetical protein
MRPIHVWRSRTPDEVRCAHFPSVITTIMDYKVQLINPFNLRSCMRRSRAKKDFSSKNCEWRPQLEPHGHPALAASKFNLTIRLT